MVLLEDDAQPAGHVPAPVRALRGHVAAVLLHERAVDARAGVPVAHVREAVDGLPLPALARGEHRIADDAEAQHVLLRIALGVQAQRLTGGVLRADVQALARVVPVKPLHRGPLPLIQRVHVRVELVVALVLAEARVGGQVAVGRVGHADAQIARPGEEILLVMAGERAHAGDGRDLQFLQDDGRVTVHKRRGDAQAPRLHVDAQGQRRVDDAALLAEDAVVAQGDRVALLTDFALLVLLPGGAFLLLRARNGVDELEDVPGQLHGLVAGFHMDEGGAASGVVQRVVQRRTVQLKHDGFLAFLIHVLIDMLFARRHAVSAARACCAQYSIAVRAPQGEKTRMLSEKA